MVKVIIADAGPLIALAGIDRLDLFKALFSTLWITSSVKKECTVKPGKDTDTILAALKSGWIKEKNIQINSRQSPRSLGKGEIDTIEWAKQLAVQKKACLLILDDRLARKYATESGLDFIGTVRVLDIAEQKGIINNAESTINTISSRGYRISPDILKKLRNQ